MQFENLDARAFHIFTTASRSGITDYANDFHRLVLAPEGYESAGPELILGSRTQFAPGTRFHVQLGVLQHRERLALSNLLRRGYAEIDATIHDPPFLTFPYFQFRSELAMRLSRGFDWYLRSLGLQRRTLERLRRIFVLSERGRSALLQLAPRANVITIPHIVSKDRIWTATSPLCPALVYFGFIGPNKGLDYALEVHRKLRVARPGTHLHVVGQASGSTGQRYLDNLRRTYSQDVTFHGYLAEDQLDILFERAAHVILPYTPYKHILPASGSVVHALRRARIVWTTDVNAMTEVIQDGQNGFILSMDLEEDAARLAAVMGNETLLSEVSEAARQSAWAMANYAYRQHFCGARS